MTMGKLDKKVAIVTGGGTGIGRAIALEFAKEGADVVICGRTMSNLKRVAGEIEALGRRCLAVQTDVSVKAHVQSLVKQTVDRFGRVDILVNNAAIIHPALLLAITEKDWDDVIDVNLKGVFLCTQAVAKHMMEQKSGKIINISSICGRGGALNDGAPYCSSKAGVILLTQVAAWELGPYGINVNAIAPGLILTPMAGTGKTKEEFEQFLEDRKKGTVLRRVGEPENIARTALFLASEDSSFISGQTIPVDGGRTNRM
jgi:3-oxoacyl-[acyl-carrier protein] reductase